MSAAIFNKSDEWRDLVGYVQKLFIPTNPLHIQSFPKLRQI